MMSAPPASFPMPLPPLPVPGGVTATQQNGYWPQPGDSIDARVADFVNQPQNSHCKALFCRLSEGSYLYGTHRTQLRVDSQTDQLQALEENEWIPMHEFVHRMEGSQSVHLQRARGEVSSASSSLLDTAPYGGT